MGLGLRVSDVRPLGSLAELTDMSGNYRLPFWKATQLHHFLHSIPAPYTFSRPQTTFEDYVWKDGRLILIVHFQRHKSNTLSPLPSSPPCALKLRKQTLKSLPDGISHPLGYTNASQRPQTFAGVVGKTRDPYYISFGPVQN